MLYMGADNSKNKPLMGISPRTTIDYKVQWVKCYTKIIATDNKTLLLFKYIHMRKNSGFTQAEQMHSVLYCAACYIKVNVNAEIESATETTKTILIQWNQSPWACRRLELAGVIWVGL